MNLNLELVAARSHEQLISPYLHKINTSLNHYFRKLAPMLQVAQALSNPPLIGFEPLPTYEYVQDIEEIPDIAIEESLKSKAISSDPVDSFWFFELDTPKEDKKKILDLSQLGATATVETSRSIPSSSSSPYVSAAGSECAYGSESTYGSESFRSSLDLLDEEMPKDLPPIRAPGTFQLFMPDPEMMERIGEIQGSLQKPEVVDGATTISASVSKSQQLDDEDLQYEPTNQHLTIPGSNPKSEKSGLKRSGSTKRVMIADPPISGSQSPPRGLSPTRPVRTDKQTKLVSYQRPKERPERSKSRNTRIREAISNPVNPSFTDRKTMENLNASMRSASELLHRRRAEGTSRYVDPLLYPAGGLPTPGTYEQRRGRVPARYNPSDQGSNPPHHIYRSTPGQTAATSHTGADHSTDRTGQAGGPGLWGLFDMAQNWIMKPVKSRRDRSEEQSRSLMRKSRTLNSQT